MDKSRLAAKQKKAQEWERFLAADIDAPQLKSTLKQSLAQFRLLLAAEWEGRDVTQELEDIEQKLENLNEEIRLVVKR